MDAPRRTSVVDYYTDVVLPALANRLQVAFPEFGWRRDGHGWVATNEEMTHRALGVRANRVVAHGPAPRGFLVHGGEATLWTAYVSGGDVPRGERFSEAVLELARRAGVDTAPVERPAPRDRRTELLHDFFTLCRWELAADAGARAREYLEQRGLPAEAIEGCGLGVVPAQRSSADCLRSSGYSDREIAQSGVLADSRWPGRLCGAWRDERGRIKTFWARTLDVTGDDARYLYLSGASRAGLPPYGLSQVIRGTPRSRELTLVEGLIDVHHLRARGYKNVAALGGTGTSSKVFERLAKLGFEQVTLCLDNDDAGRHATVKAVEHAASASVSPVVVVVDPERLARAKDPDEYVREYGVDAWRHLSRGGVCGIVWRSAEYVASVNPTSPAGERRKALAGVGTWLGTLPPRLALEQEDALRAVAERCGYSVIAVQRAFRARYWPERARSTVPELDRGV